MVAYEAVSSQHRSSSSSPRRNSSTRTDLSANNSFPFRLSALAEHANQAASIASSDQQSSCKQRIDSMFDETRSSLYGHTRHSNPVQARIEKMFQEIASSSEDEGASVSNKDSSQMFNVFYIGNVPLVDKDTTLVNLQKPLKQLYFSYRELETHNNRPNVSKLEISTEGLKVTDKDHSSKLNPFSTIAVWAAIKCVSRIEGSKLAFLPLIADPDGQDKSTLFNDLTCENERLLATGAHSPMLAVVMRQNAASKQLRCHVFVCQCSEDAIVIAANLYQALMTNIKAKQTAACSTQSQKCSMQRENPVRPPRKTKSIMRTSSEDEILPEPDEITARIQQRKITLHPADPSGDILTKVAIPRSRSFLMKHSSRGGNSLHELFAEIRSQEGIQSMDDVLEKIVDINGMSFNDLKPLYKELLLKLAVTLTRDELYLRSKSIMKRQQKSASKRGGKNARRAKKYGFKYAFRRSVKKLQTTVICHKQPNSFEFTSVLFPTNKRRTRNSKRRLSSSSNSTVHNTLRRNRDKSKSHREAIDCRLSTIAHRELRRQQSSLKKSLETVPKRETSSGYVSCSDCSFSSCMNDTDSCLDSDKCYCSMNRRKSNVVTSTSWRHHLNKPPSTSTSRALQMLLQQPLANIKSRPRASSYTSRMSVYEDVPIISPKIGSKLTSGFTSVDNLALDYELFRCNTRQNSSVYSSDSNNRQQKVLVVSARDSHGRLICMGADEEIGAAKVKPDPAKQALAVKKSAEIASLFSDLKLNQTTNVTNIGFQEGSARENVSPSCSSQTNPLLKRRRGSCPVSTGLEDSLGYLP